MAARGGGEEERCIEPFFAAARWSVYVKALESVGRSRIIYK